MSLHEEMDEAAEKGEQVEKNREQAEENREKIEALENMLEERLEEKIEGLKDEVSQTVKEELQRARAKKSETSSLEERVSGVKKAITNVEDRLDQGIAVKETKEMTDLRKKLSRFLTVADLKKRQEESLSNAMRRLQDWKIQAEGEIQDLKNKLASGVRTIQDSAETISTGAWWSLATGLVGGLVGVMMLALLSWGGYPILPQEARMTPSEISRVESSRYMDRAVEEMTEEEYDQYQTLLKKVGKRVGEPQD